MNEEENEERRRRGRDETSGVCAMSIGKERGRKRKEIKIFQFGCHRQM